MASTPNRCIKLSTNIPLLREPLTRLTPTMDDVSVGGPLNPIYILNGKAVATDATYGDDVHPLFLENGTFVTGQELAPVLAPSLVRKSSGTTINDVPTSPTPTKSDPDTMIATKHYADYNMHVVPEYDHDILLATIYSGCDQAYASGVHPADGAYKNKWQIYMEKQIVTVTFIDGYTGTSFGKTAVIRGCSLAKPTPPTHDMQEFTGWTWSVSTSSWDAVNEDCTVTANYAQQYQVVFIDLDGTILSTQSITGGKSATAPADPSQTYYTFSRWNSNEWQNVTKNLTILAVYRPWWKINFLSYKVNESQAGGNTPISAGTSIYVDQDVGLLAKCTNASMSGRTFSAWYWDSTIVDSTFKVPSATHESWYGGNTSHDEKNLLAAWTVTTTAYYTMKSSVWQTVKSAVDYLGNCGSISLSTSTPTDTSTPRDLTGWSFNGWQDSYSPSPSQNQSVHGSWSCTKKLYRELYHPNKSATEAKQNTNYALDDTLHIQGIAGTLSASDTYGWCYHTPSPEHGASVRIGMIPESYRKSTVALQMIAAPSKRMPVKLLMTAPNSYQDWSYYGDNRPGRSLFNTKETHKVSGKNVTTSGKICSYYAQNISVQTGGGIFHYDVSVEAADRLTYLYWFAYTRTMTTYDEDGTKLTDGMPKCTNPPINRPIFNTTVTTGQEIYDDFNSKGQAESSLGLTLNFK